MYTVRNPGLLFTRLVLDESGVLERLTWNNNKWVGFWSVPKDQCDTYKECGPNSYSNPYDIQKIPVHMLTRV
jgi:hypothetical protein